jgi:hypothetical protein
MAFNGSVLRNGLLALITGGIIAIILFMTISNFIYPFFSPEDPPDDPIVEDTLGKIIAKQMETKESNIEYVWIYNNTWVNVELSAHYYPAHDKMIDGLLFGYIEENFSLALIHEPEADITQINRSELSPIMTKFRTAIVPLNTTSLDVQSIDDMWPPSFLMDIAYVDGSSFSIAFSQQYSVLGFFEGNWTQTEWDFWGVKVIQFSYNTDNFTFLDITDVSDFYAALGSLAAYIFSTFPA